MLLEQHLRMIRSILHNRASYRIETFILDRLFPELSIVDLKGWIFDTHLYEVFVVLFRFGFLFFIELDHVRHMLTVKRVAGWR